MDIEDYRGYIPKASGIVFTPRKEILTKDIANQFWNNIYARHTRPDGTFADMGTALSKADATLYRAYKDAYYHKIQYLALESAEMSKEAASKRYRGIDTDEMLGAVTRECAVLQDRFPKGKYRPGVSIVDEPCVFLDRNRLEIACYDRWARTRAMSAACEDALLDVLKDCSEPRKDSKRHPETPRIQDSWGGQNIRRHTRHWYSQGVKHLCWCWFPKIPTQGSLVSADLRESMLARYWGAGVLGLATKPMFMQAALTVRARNTKLFNTCVAAVKRASGVKYGSNGTAASPLVDCPFNGCAVIFLKDTKDHKDASNAPGMYGVTQPLGRYPMGEGTMTLLQLGVVLLYRPLDTLAADFYSIAHWTAPLTRGYRYCLTSFIHQAICDFRSTEDARASDDSNRLLWREQKRQRLKRKADSL